MKKIFFYLIIFTSLTILSYTFYKSEIAWNGTKRDYYINFYYFSVFVIFLSVLYYFLNNNFKTYFIISLVSIIFSLYSFEFLFLKKDLGTTQLIDNKNNLTKLEFYNDLKKKHKNVGFSFGPYYFLNTNKFEIFPFSGKSNSKIINCNESGYFSTYLTDRFGFNNSDNIWEKESFDFVLVGDSYVEGACVNKPYDLTSVLSLNSNYDFLNLAHGGNGPLVAYAVAKEYLSDRKFKNLIYFFSEGNDLENLNSEIKNKQLINYLDNYDYSQNLLQKVSVVDGILNKITENEINDQLKRNKDIRAELDYRAKININPETKKFKIFRALKLYHTRSMIFKKQYDMVYNPLKVDTAIENEVKKILRLMKRFSLENNANFYIAYLPTWMKYNGFNDFDDRYYLLKKITSELEINFIDLHKDFFQKTDNPNKYFVYGGNSHYNEKGYNDIANYVLDFLKNE